MKDSATCTNTLIPMDVLSPDNDGADPSTAFIDHSDQKRRYAISEWKQFWIVLKRTLLFSLRDWVCILIIILNKHESHSTSRSHDIRCIVHWLSKDLF